MSVEYLPLTPDEARLLRRIMGKRHTEMVQRCTDPGDKSWVRYGGRGIVVSDEFRFSLDALIRELVRDPNHVHIVRHGDSRAWQIDRIDNGRGYVAGNVRIVHQSVNHANRDKTPKRLVRKAVDVALGPDDIAVFRNSESGTYRFHYPGGDRRNISCEFQTNNGKGTSNGTLLTKAVAMLFAAFPYWVREQDLVAELGLSRPYVAKIMIAINTGMKAESWTSGGYRSWRMHHEPNADHAAVRDAAVQVVGIQWKKNRTRQPKEA
jgi:hypothetical protein